MRKVLLAVVLVALAGCQLFDYASVAVTQSADEGNVGRGGNDLLDTDGSGTALTVEGGRFFGPVREGLTGRAGLTDQQREVLVRHSLQMQDQETTLADLRGQLERLEQRVAELEAEADPEAPSDVLGMLAARQGFLIDLALALLLLWTTGVLPGLIQKLRRRKPDDAA